VDSGVRGRLREFVPAGNQAVVGFEFTWPDEDVAESFYQVVTMPRGRIVHIQDHASRRAALASLRGMGEPNPRVPLAAPATVRPKGRSSAPRQRETAAPRHYGQQSGTR
jgi:hypothetical protein